MLLPNGWTLTPEGQQVPISDLPLNMVLSKDGRWVVTTRYELQHMPKATFFAEEDDALINADLAYYVNPNARVGFDWAHTSDNVRGPKVDEMQVFVHVGY